MTATRTDWFRLLTLLDRAGINLPTVAVTLGISYKTLHSIKAGGGEPRYETGRQIIELYCQCFPGAEVPIEPRPMSAARAKV